MFLRELRLRKNRRILEKRDLIVVVRGDVMVVRSLGFAANALEARRAVSKTSAERKDGAGGGAR